MDLVLITATEFVVRSGHDLGRNGQRGISGLTHSDDFIENRDFRLGRHTFAGISAAKGLQQQKC